MKITKEIIRTMNYVRETSCRTEPTYCPYYGVLNENGTYSRRREDSFELDYSNIKYQKIELSDEEFISFDEKVTKKIKKRVR